MSSIFTNASKFMNVAKISGSQDIDHTSINTVVDQVNSRFGTLEQSYTNLIQQDETYIREYMKRISDPYTILSMNMENTASYLNNDTFNIMGDTNSYKGYYHLYFSEQGFEDLSRYNIIILYKPSGYDDFYVANPNAIHMTNYFQGLQVYLHPSAISSRFYNADSVDIRIIVQRHILSSPITSIVPIHLTSSSKSLVGTINSSELGSVNSATYCVPMIKSAGSNVWHKNTRDSVTISDLGNSTYRYSNYNTDYIQLGEHSIGNSLESLDIGFAMSYKSDTSMWVYKDSDESELALSFMGDLNDGSSNRNLKVPLIKKQLSDGSYVSVPYLDKRDFMVFINNIKLAASDYEITENEQFGSVLSLNVNSASSTVYVRIVKNIPFTENNLYYYVENELNPYGIGLIEKQLALFGPENGMLFVNRHYTDMTNINQVIGKYIDMSFIDVNQFEIFSNFYIEDNVKSMIDLFVQTKTESEKMLSMMGMDDQDTLIQNYADNNNLPEIDFKSVWNPSILAEVNYDVLDPQFLHVYKNEYLTIPIDASGLTVKWFVESGNSATLSSAGSTSCKFKSSFDEYQYSIVRAFVMNSVGSFKTQVFIINQLNIIEKPEVVVTGVPESSPGDYYDIALEFDSNVVDYFDVGVSAGGAISDLTGNTFQLSTTRASEDVYLCIDVYSKGIKSEMAGLPMVGLGEDLYTDSDITDGVTRLTYTIVKT